MSRQLAFSAVLSVLATAGLALAAPAIADQLPAIAGAHAGATFAAAAPAVFAD